MNEGVCEHERIQPIQDHPSLGVRAGAVRAFGACRRTRPATPEQGGGSGLQAAAGRRCASVQAGPRTCTARAGRGAGMPIAGHRLAASPTAPCRRAISADTPIAAASPGRADAGITKSTMDVTAGGGMSAAFGITTRNRWKVRRPIFPRTMPMMSADRMGRPSPTATHRHRPALMHRRRRPAPDPAASAVGGAIVGGLIGGLLTGHRERRGRRCDCRRGDRRDRRRAGRVAARLLSVAGQLLLSVSVGPVRAGRSAACY